MKTPFGRIQKAADVMQPGDTCLIRGGEYREKIVGVSEQPMRSLQDFAARELKPFGFECPLTGVRDSRMWPLSRGRPGCPSMTQRLAMWV